MTMQLHLFLYLEPTDTTAPDFSTLAQFLFDDVHSQSSNQTIHRRLLIQIPFGY